MPIINTNVEENIDITQNGQYDIRRYSTANIDVATSRPQYCIEYEEDEETHELVKKSLPPFQFPDSTGITKIGENSLYYGYYGCNFPENTTLNWFGITEIGKGGCYYAFRDCTGLTAVNLGSLTTIDISGCNDMFYNSSITSLDMHSIQSLTGASGLCYRCSNLESINLSSVTTITGAGNLCTDCVNLKNVQLGNNMTATLGVAFSGCTSLETVHGSIITIGGSLSSLFSGCTSLKDINILSTARNYLVNNSPMSKLCYGCTSLIKGDLHSFEGYWGTTSSILENAFYGCTSMTSLDLRSCVNMSGQYGFRYLCDGCILLNDVNFSSLKYIPGANSMNNAFRNCSNLRSISFPALESISSNAFTSMLTNCSDVTVHLPSNFGTTINPSNLGGTNTAVLYDLVSTQHIYGNNSVEYCRNPKDDTSTALSWREKQNDTSQRDITWTPYYTSGTTYPQSGDTLYSDPECTTAVTTIQ